MTTPTRGDAALDALTDVVGRSDQYPEHTYTYLACDLLTDTVLAELPLQQVTYETLLSGIGSLRAFLPVNDETNQLGVLDATVGGRTALYVDRDGVIVWGGIIWTRDVAQGGVNIQAAEFLSYYQHRYIVDTLSTNTANITLPDYVPVGQRLYADQKWLMWSLFAYAASKPGGNIRIDINSLTGAGSADGITRDVTYNGYEMPEIYASMQTLSQADSGFDFGIEVGWNPITNGVAPTRYRRARTWHPQRGRVVGDSGLVFTKGGPAASIVGYDWPEDWTATSTTAYALGAGDGASRLIASASDGDMAAAGWPLLESVATYQDVTVGAQLQAHVNADLTARSAAAVAPWFDVLADSDPQFGSYQLGDQALMSLAPEPRWPLGLDVVVRIIGQSVTASRGPEVVRLTCTGV